MALRELTVEQKSLIDNIIRKILSLFQIEDFRVKVKDYVEQQYLSGIDDQEIKLQMNFVPDDKKVDFLTKYASQSLEFHTDALGNDLRGVISQAIMNGFSTSQLKHAVRDAFNDDKFSNRLKAVLRTEGMRANNFGSYDAAVQSGIPLKKWVQVKHDDRTSETCLKEEALYGSPAKAIPLEEPFIVIAPNGEEQRVLVPPFHVNCRSVPMFERIADGE